MERLVQVLFRRRGEKKLRIARPPLCLTSSSGSTEWVSSSSFCSSFSELFLWSSKRRAYVYSRVSRRGFRFLPFPKWITKAWKERRRENKRRSRLQRRLREDFEREEIACSMRQGEEEQEDQIDEESSPEQFNPRPKESDSIDDFPFHSSFFPFFYLSHSWRWSEFFETRKRERKRKTMCKRESFTLLAKRVLCSFSFFRVEKEKKVRSRGSRLNQSSFSSLARRFLLSL